jgi:hypothetical protein
VIYSVYLDGTKKIAEFAYAGPLIAVGDRLPIKVEGRESLYYVTRVSGLSPENEVGGLALSVDLWVRDWFDPVE